MRRAGTVLLVLLGLAGATSTHAASVRLEATVQEDLQVVVGTVELVEGEGLRLVDTLSQLPVPQDDQALRRTFPGPREEGWVHIETPEGPRSAFHTVLPRRSGAAGMVPGRGLFASGHWHPLPLRGGEAEVVHWEVRLHLPEGTTGVLNGVVAEGLLEWSGEADRLALAVIPGARVETLELPVGELVVVDRGPPRGRRAARLQALLRDSWPGPGAPELVVVETPSRRRLARAAPGVLFLSDRALRVSGGLWRYHVPAVREGLIEATLPVEGALRDPWVRGFVASAVSDELSAQDPDLRELLGWVSWIPQVDSLLYDGRLPFYADTFAETWPGDRVQDDLREVLRGETPPRAVARWVDLRFGAGTSRRVAERLLQGEELDISLAVAGVPPSAVRGWRQPQVALDHVLAVSRVDEGWEVRVHRELEGQPVEDTPGAALPVPVELQLGEERRSWFGDEPEFVEVFGDRPRLVQVDPDHHLPPQPRANDRWPLRWTVVTALFPTELTLRTGRVSAFAAASFRRQYDTRWRFDTSLETSPRDLVQAEVGAVHYMGPLLDRRTRPLRAWAGVNASLLDPAFRPTELGTTALGTYLGLAWETRVDPDFPRRGHRLSLGTSGGIVPGSEERWGSLGVGAIGLVPLGGRATWASRASGGVATGDVEHRLLGLGGGGAVQGLPYNAALGNGRLVGGTELRVEAMRHASVPLPLLWWADTQLTLGLEAGQLWTGRPEEISRAVGWVAGVGFVGDVLGARPTLLHLTFARPVWWEPEPLVTGGFPEVYLRWDHPF